MSDFMCGRYAMTEPGGGLTVLSMDGGEIDLFGAYTSIKTTATDFFSDIGDSLTEKAVEHTAVIQFALGALVTAVFAGLAIAAVSAATAATGGLALVALGAAAGCAGTALGTGLYTAGMFAHDTITGYNRSNDKYIEGLIKAGAYGFSTGLGVYLSILSFPAAPTFALASGEIASGAAIALPTIITNVAETVLALDGVITAGVLLSEALNGDGEGQQGDKDGIHFEEGGKNNSGNRGESKPSNKPYKNNKEANRQAQKQGYKDAHELKEDYVGKSNVSKYDMKYDTKTGEIYLESKDGKIQIPTGLMHEP